MAEPDGTLTPLSRSGQMIADPNDDVRSRAVVDSAGEKIGTVADLLVDTVTNHVRFLRVEHGGILGFGAQSSFVPVEAIIEVTEDEVRVDSSKDHIAGGPGYDPDLADQRAYYEDIYAHYGRVPGAPGGYLSGMPYSPGLPPVR
ncbi:PRC-barrel domain-containing protein [Actinoplanes sp. G11-F43]|uniref:PRC-barrel domain-containing protein n=1 Tax=Actinoplanes sp. G11-F43 TaxID=3424130 RepID=UPI003D348631